jgi:Ca2+-binding RTX toxin-like protein
MGEHIMASFVGTSGNDTITPALISSGVVSSPPGADLSGNDSIVADAGNDLVEGDGGTDVAFLGAGDDRFIWNPGDGDDVVHGRRGRDTLIFNGSDADELMTVTTLENGGFRFFRDVGNITVDTTSVERVVVDAGDDADVINGSAQTRSDVALVIRGGDGNDRMRGGAGNDWLVGDAGDDRASGGRGNDRFVWRPGDGDDVFSGQSGRDTLDFRGSDADEQMTITTLDNGGFQFLRDVGDITVDTTRVERVVVTAGGGADLINASAQTRSDVAVVVRGGDGNDTVRGGAGADNLAGGEGDDRLAGGRGNDRLVGDEGDDRLGGGRGNDRFVGGGGADTVIIGNETRNGRAETDTVFGYDEDAGDVIDLSAAGGLLGSTAAGGNLVVSLNGGDTLIIRGVTSVADVTFIL